jgi:Kef-type K+ transport system membrane component KefB/mannitol/fructose-specific phosphotransferase system IIA component (Ntr-type)
LDKLDASQLTVMLLALGILIGGARLLGELARRLHQPAVLGELLAGVILGPTMFGALFPDLQAFLFPTTGPNALVLDGISSLAIVLFLLVAGIEVDLSIVWKQGRAALKIGILGTVIPFAIGLACAWLAPTALGMPKDADLTVFVLFIATAMSISALPVIARILMDLDLYRTDLGMTVVSAAIFNDLVGWTVFALILGLMNDHGNLWSVLNTVALTLLFAGLVLTVGRWLIHRALPALQAYTHWPGGVLGFMIATTLFGAALTEWIGIHAIFGSFLVGTAFGASSHMQERTRTMLDRFVSFVFAPIFFAGIGLKVNFVTHFDPALVLTVLVIACIAKFLGAWLGARWGELPPRERWAVGAAMNVRGAMEIILGVLALQAGVIDERLFVALVVMALLTSAAGGPLMRYFLRRKQPNRLIPLLSPRHFVRELKATTRQEAIAELGAVAGEQAGVDVAEVERLAWKREQLAATGIGNGVALPHARLKGLPSTLAIVGISEPGVSFDAPDGEPAHLIVLVLTPQEDPSAQLEISADVARRFRDPASIQRILRTTNFTEFLAQVKMLEG